MKTVGKKVAGLMSLFLITSLVLPDGGWATQPASASNPTSNQRTISVKPATTQAAAPRPTPSTPAVTSAFNSSTSSPLSRATPSPASPAASKSKPAAAPPASPRLPALPKSPTARPMILLVNPRQPVNVPRPQAPEVTNPPPTLNTIILTWIGTITWNLTATWKDPVTGNFLDGTALPFTPQQVSEAMILMQVLHGGIKYSKTTGQWIQAVDNQPVDPLTSNFLSLVTTDGAINFEAVNSGFFPGYTVKSSLFLVCMSENSCFTGWSEMGLIFEKNLSDTTGGGGGTACATPGVYGNGRGTICT